jgi:hypothetical protein
METKKCKKCNNVYDVDDFFFVYRKNKKNINRLPYCKRCWVIVTKEYNTKRKQAAVDYKGGKCVKCGYNKCLGALEFHHRDPEAKEFAICKKWSLEKMKAELDKCDLVCSNCHKETHYTMQH